MKQERDKLGRFTTDGPPKEKQINIKVTPADYKAIKDMQKQGISPRDVIVEVAQKATKANE